MTPDCAFYMLWVLYGVSQQNMQDFFTGYKLLQYCVSNTCASTGADRQAEPHLCL